MVFELNIESHLLDPQLVSSWSKIFMTLPQRSGLESRGHSVTVGKTILSIGKVNTTDFIGFSCQPASLKSICSRCQTKCNVKSVLVQFKKYIGQLINKKNIASARSYDLRFEPWSTTQQLSHVRKIGRCEQLLLRGWKRPSVRCLLK